MSWPDYNCSFRKLLAGGCGMINWAYIAGFLDGDGWITGSKNKNCSTIRFTVGFTQKSTAKKEMYLLFDYLKQHNIKANFSYRVSKGSINKEVEMVNIYVREINSTIKLLENLIPYLLFKKDKAIYCVEYLKNKKHKKGKWIIGDGTNRYWSKVEVWILKRKLKGGFHPSAIADMLGRSSQSVSQKLSRLRKKNLL